MRALVVLGVAFACVYGCGGDDGAGSPPSNASAGEGGSDAAGGDGVGATSVGATQTSGGAAGNPSSAGAAGDVATPSDGGMNGSAGAAGAGQIASIGIVAAETHFTDYGKLRIAFEAAVDANTLTINLLPQRPARLTAAAVTQVNPTTVDVTLGYYHLPRDYRLDVSGELLDATPFTASLELSGQGNGARAAFLSKQVGSGDFKSWAGAAGAATPVAAVDAVCQAEATAAGLRGTFQAFVSVAGTLDAGCRGFGLEGTLADNCGQASPPVDHAPILGLDGTPIVAGGSGIIADAWAIPIGLYADGTAASPAYTWTGTISGAKGYADDDCGHWADTSKVGIASIEVATSLLDYEFGRACTVSGDVICLQTAGTFFGPSKLHEVYGKRVFVSKGHVYGTIAFGGKTGVPAADALCQSEATAAALDNPDKFHAYVGTADTDALCYVLGQDGEKVADHCGLAALPNAEPWRRVDNYPVGTAKDLAGSTLRAPIMLGADSTWLVHEKPRTGTEISGATSWNCGDWSSAGFYSISGDPRFVDRNWTFSWTTDCDQEEASVYCFER